jgi:hypothetical protein
MRRWQEATRLSNLLLTTAFHFLENLVFLFFLIVVFFVMAACVTRILELRGFDAKVKTRDVHAAFADFGETFKIKWINDNSLYLVFNDAVAGMWLLIRVQANASAHD